MRSHFFSLSYCRRRRALSGGRFIEFWKTRECFRIRTHRKSYIPPCIHGNDLAETSVLVFFGSQRFLGLTWETLQPMTSRPVLTSYILSEIIFLFSHQTDLCLMTEYDFKQIFLLNSTFQTIFLYFLKETAFAKLTATIMGDCQCVAVLGSC